MVSTGCTIQKRTGEFCDAPPAEGMPYPVCPKHCIEIFRWQYHMVSDLTTVASDRVVTNRGVPDSNPSWVYYALTREGLIKIGYSANPAQRMTGLGLTLDDLLALEPGDRRTERGRHSLFRIIAYEQTEYFRPTEELQQHVKMIRARHGHPREVLGLA